jgi:hypothetical protein
MRTAPTETHETAAESGRPWSTLRMTSGLDGGGVRLRREEPAPGPLPYVPPDADPPAPARVPEPWPPPDEADRPDPNRQRPGEPDRPSRES